MSSLLDAIRGLTPQQQEAVLKLDPVLRVRGTTGALQVIGSITNLTLIDGFAPAQVTDLLVAFAEDLFAAHMDIAAYSHLLAADDRDHGRRAVNCAIERRELIRFHANFDPIRITLDDWHRAFEAAFSGGHLEEALACVSVQMADRSLTRYETFCYRRILDAAVEEGDLQTASRCLSYLGRDFTRPKGRKIARRILQDHVRRNDLDSAEFNIVVRHASKPARAAYLLSVCKASSLDCWNKLVELADRLDIEFTAKYLEAILDNNTTSGATRISAMKHLLEMGKTPRREERLEALCKEARDHAMLNSEIAEADAYGSQIGEPLTPNELLAYIREWSRSREDDDWHYRQHIPWARELLLARLQDPSAPAPPAPQR